MTHHQSMEVADADPPVEKSVAEDTKAWKTQTEDDIPKNNLPVVFFSLLLTTFLVCVQCLIMCPVAEPLGSALIRRRWTRRCELTTLSILSDSPPIRVLCCSVATALPTIVAELKGGQNYSWVGR